METPVLGEPRVNILGFPIWNPSYEEFRRWFEAAARDRSSTRLLGIVNAHTLNLAQADPAYGQCLRSMDVLINDGIGLGLAARMRGTPFKDNLNGTDLFPRLLGELERPLRVFLYGAREQSNAGAAEAIGRRFPAVEVVGRINGYADPEREALPAIRQAEADVLLAALGQPRQELFLSRYKAELGVAIACGVGALFDFLSGAIPRAPEPMRRLKIEWLFRLWLEPGRMFSRYVVGNPLFLARAARWARRDVESNKH